MYVRPSVSFGTHMFLICVRVCVLFCMGQWLLCPNMCVYLCVVVLLDCCACVCMVICMRGCGYVYICICLYMYVCALCICISCFMCLDMSVCATFRPSVRSSCCVYVCMCLYCIPDNVVCVGVACILSPFLVMCVCGNRILLIVFGGCPKPIVYRVCWWWFLMHGAFPQYTAGQHSIRNRMLCGQCMACVVCVPH